MDTMETQITQSGIQYAVEYLGSIPIESSIQEMTTDLRVLVVQECIYMLAKAHNLVDPDHNKEINTVAKKVIGDGEMKLRKDDGGGPLKAELNIQAKQIRIVGSRGMIARHPISHVSFAAKGAFGNFFGYVGKKADGTDRRCYALRFPETNTVMSAIDEAMRLYAESQSPFKVPDSRDVSEVITHNVREMENEPWYHGILSRGVAEGLLQKDGDFLVRQSTNSPGQIILSGREGTPKHVLLIDKNKVRTREREFPSVRALIRFHSETGALITSEESVLRLTRPIPRS